MTAFDRGCGVGVVVFADRDQAEQAAAGLIETGVRFLESLATLLQSAPAQSASAGAGLASLVSRDPRTNELLVDLSDDGQRWLAARGGRGGFGNARFATSTNRAPRYHQEGSPGEEFEFQLELHAA